MPKSKTLLASKRKKNDEFYTLYQDIADEVPYYRDQLRGKRILCPCDWDESYDEVFVYKAEDEARRSDFFGSGTVKEIDLPRSSPRIERDVRGMRCNFAKFLVAHAEAYGIRSVSVSGYNPRTGQGVRFQDIDYSRYDLIITNPPFSIFGEFIDVLMKNGKQFLVIGPLTAISYKNIFRYIQTNRMWLGYAKQLSGFVLGDGTALMAKCPEGSVARACKWYTNLDVSYRHDELILTELYEPEKYPSYFNYDAIEVSKTKKIPDDWTGKMGVPISFLSKYNPQQFEIIGQGQYVEKTRPCKDNCLWIGEDEAHLKKPFDRIIIRRRPTEEP